MKKFITAATLAVALALGGAAGVAVADEVYEPQEPTYTVVLWEATTDAQFPQHWRAYGPTTDLNLSDGSADLDALKVNLEPCTLYQGDVYEDGPALDALIAGGVLTGPSQPNPEPWPGGQYQPQYSVVWTTEGCNPDAIVVVPTVPEVKDLCETENDHYGLPDNVPGILYSRDGLDIQAVLEEGYAWGELPEGWAVDEGRIVFPFAFTAWTDEDCEVPPPTNPPTNPPARPSANPPVLAETGADGTSIANMSALGALLALAGAGAIGVRRLVRR